jgi:hypothetical protein
MAGMVNPLSEPDHQRFRRVAGRLILFGGAS